MTFFRKMFANRLLSGIYTKVTWKCPYDNSALYDPSVNSSGELRECQACGRMWGPK